MRGKENRRVVENEKMEEGKQGKGKMGKD